MSGVLADKVILVTGAAQGIGREYAHKLSAAGAIVVATDIQHDKVSETAEEVRGAGVVGQTPVIEPGKAFHYTSGCPLKTPQGIMVGSYQMTDEAGKLFDVAIGQHVLPEFQLSIIYLVRIGRK